MRLLVFGLLLVTGCKQKNKNTFFIINYKC